MPTSRYELWASHVTAKINKDRTDYSSLKALSHPFCWLPVPNGQLGESARVAKTRVLCALAAYLQHSQSYTTVFTV